MPSVYSYSPIIDAKMTLSIPSVFFEGMSALQAYHIEHLIRYLWSYATTLDDLITFGKVDQDHREVVDRFVMGLWVKVLTTADIQRAFATDAYYIVEQAMIACSWYLDDKIITDPPDNDVSAFPYQDYFVTATNRVIIETAIRYGYMDRTDRYGRTPLIHACMNGHLDKVDQLITRECDIYIKDRDGRTALVHAIRRGRSDIASLVLGFPFESTFIERKRCDRRCA